MMLALVLLAQVPTVGPVPTEDEIVVIAKRLDAIAVTVGRDARGRYHCSLSASSGNARIDERLCRTSSTCVRKGANDGAAVKACVQQRKAGLLEAFRRELAKRRT
jgi:hypothetical protein